MSLPALNFRWPIKSFQNRRHTVTFKHEGWHHNTTKKSPESLLTQSSLKKRRLPTLPRVCSTIGAGGLNFSVRNGKRWNPATIATWNKVDISLHNFLQVQLVISIRFRLSSCSFPLFAAFPASSIPEPTERISNPSEESFRAISRARLWCRHLYTSTLSTS